MLYLWIKALHIIAIVCWFAGLFYLPRLFVYHAMAEDQTSRERFCVMERKLSRGIMNPSMIATLVFGAWLLYLNPAWLKMGWLHAKLLLVALMLAQFIVCGRWLKGVEQGRALPSPRTLRLVNELPVLALLVVIWLVLGKPF